MINAQTLKWHTFGQGFSDGAAMTLVSSSGGTTGELGLEILDTAGYDYLSIYISAGKSGTSGNKRFFTSGVIREGTGSTSLGCVTPILASAFYDTSGGLFRMPIATSVSMGTAVIHMNLDRRERYIGAQLRTVAGSTSPGLGTPWSVIGALSRGEQSPWDTTGWGVDAGGIVSSS